MILFNENKKSSSFKWNYMFFNKSIQLVIFYIKKKILNYLYHEIITSVFRIF